MSMAMAIFEAEKLFRKQKNKKKNQINKNL